VEIEDELGFTDEVDELDAIVASEETGKNAELINKVRASNGMKQLEVIIIPLVLDDITGRKLSCRLPEQK
ncbi:MAG: phosphopantetheine adenylyltransferase, partial [Candidatus Micrarchaeia archaeon]|jgi:phosphopantetheine adenylyltransferase